MAKASNVSTGKPAVVGAISVAPLGTKLPTTASEQLDEAFENLGYISDDGLTNTNSLSSDSIQAWGGDTVLTVGSSKEDQWKFALLEVMNPSVLKLIYGENNVTGDLKTGITIKSNSTPLSPHTFVVDLLLSQNAMKRIVIPNATVTATDDISYKDKSAITYGTTISAVPDEAGNTHYEYLIQADSSKATDSSAEEGKE